MELRIANFKMRNKNEINRSWKLEAGDWKLEAIGWRLEIGSWKLEVGG
jgi:hypothetical protein